MSRQKPSRQASQYDAVDAEAVAFLGSLQSSVPMGVGFVDRSFRFVRANEILATINGCPAEGHIGRTVAEVVPALWPEIEPHYHRVLGSGEMVLNVEITGSGYPGGLGGEEISIGARIIAVADTVEAMASHRPYRAALGIDVALDQIKERRSTKFDLDVVDVVLDLFGTGRAKLDLGQRPPPGSADRAPGCRDGL